MYIIKTKPKTFHLTASNFVKDKLDIILQTKDSINVALAGGSTPLPILNLLAKEKIEWNKINFYQTDERIVPENDTRSNFHNLTNSFLSKIQSKAYPMYKGGKTPENSCNDYVIALSKINKNKGIPVFDLIILGMGEDGHIASLFPGSPLLFEKKKTVILDPYERNGTLRMTLSLPVFTNASETIIFLSGSIKYKLLKSNKSRFNLPIDLLIKNNKNITAICSVD